MSILPEFQFTIEKNPLNKKELSVPKEYAFDFENNQFILVDGKPIIVEGLKAIEIWIKKMLLTPRYKYKAYSWNYGHELDELVGKNYSKEAIKSEAERYLKETLMVNPYIKTISEVKTELEGAKLTIICNITTEYGEVMINV